MTTSTIERVIAPDAPEYLTIKDAALRVGVTPWTIFKLIEVGQIETVRYGRLVLVSSHDVVRLGGVIA